MQNERHLSGTVPPWLIRSAPLIGILALYVLILVITWDGFGPRDAEPYSHAALKWLREGRWLGEDHWALRYPLMLPIVLSFAILGPSEFAACVPNMIFGAGLIAVSFYYLRRHAGVVPATTMGLLLATSGFFLFQATELRVYGPEVLFVVTGLWLIIDGGRREGAQYARFAGAGVMGGLAWLCRESAVFLPPMLIAGAFLWGEPRFRRAGTTAVAAASVLLLEWIFYAVAAGDPLYRLKTDLGHGDGKPESVPFTGPAGEPGDFWILPIKNVLLDPIVMPVVLGGLGLALLALFKVPLFRFPARTAIPLGYFAASTALSLGICSYILSLETTEYFPLLTYTGHLAAALVIGNMIAQPSAWARGPGGAGLFALMLANLWGNDLRDDRDYYPAHELRNYILETGQKVATDSTTSARVRLSLMLRGMSEREARSYLHTVFEGGTAPPDHLVYAAASAGPVYALEPAENWVFLEEWSAPPHTAGKRVLLHALPAPLRSDAIDHRFGPAPPSRLYRTPPAHGHEDITTSRVGGVD